MKSGVSVNQAAIDFQHNPTGNSHLTGSLQGAFYIPSDEERKSIEEGLKDFSEGNYSVWDLDLDQESPPHAP